MSTGLTTLQPQTAAAPNGRSRTEIRFDVMSRRHISLGGVIYLGIGVVVAASNHFFRHLNSLSQFLSLALAVIAWPLVALNIHVAI